MALGVPPRRVHGRDLRGWRRPACVAAALVPLLGPRPRDPRGVLRLPHRDRRDGDRGGPGDRVRAQARVPRRHRVQPRGVGDPRGVRRAVLGEGGPPPTSGRASSTPWCSPRSTDSRRSKVGRRGASTRHSSDGSRGGTRSRTRAIGSAAERRDPRGSFFLSPRERARRTRRCPARTLGRGPEASGVRSEAPRAMPGPSAAAPRAARRALRPAAPGFGCRAG